MATDVIIHFDADTHFAIWNGRARGKEKAMLMGLEWLMNKWDLRRVTAEIPAYQKGVIRFAKRLGFVEEGERRDAVLYKGSWVGATILGLTIS